MKPFLAVMSIKLTLNPAQPQGLLTSPEPDSHWFKHQFKIQLVESPRSSGYLFSCLAALSSPKWSHTSLFFKIP